MRIRERVSRMRVDLTPLRASKDFRLLFWSGSVVNLGGMVSYVAVPYQLYTLTRSNFAVGALGIAELVPLLVFGLYGGALADAVDRRQLVLWTSAAQVGLTALLMVNAFLPVPRLWAIYALAALLSAAQSLQRPSSEALVPRTVGHSQLTAAAALSGLGMQLGALLGPGLGGLMLQGVGAGWCFAVDVAGLSVATALLTGLASYPPTDASNTPSIGGIVEGIRYAVGRRDLLGTYVIDLVAMFMAMPVVLFPSLAATVFHRPGLLGLLYSAETVGAILATATSGWTSRVRRHGRVVVVAATLWGAATALAGLAPNIWLVLACFTVGGAADMVSGIFRHIIWNQTIPDTMRGRLAGVEMLSYSVGPLGGQVRAGLVADRFSVRTSITSGGVLCVLGVAATAAWLRDFWSYDAVTDPFAAAERAARGSAEGHQPA